MGAINEADTVDYLKGSAKFVERQPRSVEVDDDPSAPLSDPGTPWIE